MDQQEWDQEERSIAEGQCKKTHLDVFRSTVGSDGVTKYENKPCHLCRESAKQRVLKLKRAHGTEITDPEEIARINQELGIEPDLATADTLPGNE
jgi:hypothetical protein